MAKQDQTQNRVRSRRETVKGELDYSIKSVARHELQDFGYSENTSDCLANVLLELREDDPAETAEAFRLFRKIAGVTRKPRTKKTQDAAK